jgi:hypothetical protein
MSNLPRGICPVCSREVALRVRGELREHRGVGERKCPGSGWTIEQLEAEIDREVEALRGLAPMTPPGQSDTFRITLAWLRANWGVESSWALWRKRSLTNAIHFGPLGRPHVIRTKEGDYQLPLGWEGYIAIDADGDPYPIEIGVFTQTYERDDG